jgi:hypothetical protein
MVHFADFESFSRAIAEDGFYENGRPLKKALATACKGKAIATVRTRGTRVDII